MKHEKYNTEEWFGRLVRKMNCMQHRYFVFIYLHFNGSQLFLLNASALVKQESEFHLNFRLFLFYVVLVVGLVDYIISFLRVEGLLKILLTDKFALNLGISSFRGTYIHLPIIVICSIISLFIKENLSFKWLSFMIVISEFLIVITRFIFSYEQSFMSDLVRMWYSALFLFASSHALITEGHVRVDVLYSQMKKKKQSLMNMIGCMFLGIPLCWTILGCGLWTKYSSINSSLISFEVYQQGFGMYVKYIMVGFLLIFALSMIVQFMAYFLDNVRIYLVPKED